MHDEVTRRAFMSRAMIGAGALFALGTTEQLADARAYAARQVSNATGAFGFFTQAEAADMAAVCEQIIPSEPGSPGAREAGAVYFADYALDKLPTVLQSDLRPMVRQGLADLTTKARAIDATKRFADLTADQQVTILKGIEATDFFRRVRELTIWGYLGDPTHGGNRGQVGWQHIGFDNAGAYEPPFGYYDAERAAGRGGER
ncbi:MAG: gluconate 2-dehydrogenase subunit 3 family protein [Acidobacteriota bacterium]